MAQDKDRDSGWIQPREVFLYRDQAKPSPVQPIRIEKPDKTEKSVPPPINEKEWEEKHRKLKLWCINSMETINFKLTSLSKQVSDAEEIINDARIRSKKLIEEIRNIKSYLESLD